MSVKGKNILVTGACSGIGAAIALAYAEAGAQVFCADIKYPEQTLGQIKNVGGAANAVVCDVSSEESVLNMFDKLKQDFQVLDILAHCAGVIDEKPLLETTAEDFDRVVSVNLRGSFLVGREAIRVMKHNQTKGRVILMASDLSYVGRETFSAYVASKHAVMGLTKSWAKEFAPDILVNAICPGPIDTAMLGSANMTEEWREKELDIPLHRFGMPSDVAKMAVFLGGDGAEFITGQGFGVNGGSVMV